MDMENFTCIAAAKSLQLCPTLCDPRDSSPPGSPVPGILHARTLEWVATSFSNAWKWKMKVKSLSRIRLVATPWTAAHQAPPSMGFSRQEYWSGVPLPSLVLRWPKSLLRFFFLYLFLTGGQSGFSTRCYRKTQTNFLANAISFSFFSSQPSSPQ